MPYPLARSLWIIDTIRLEQHKAANECKNDSADKAKIFIAPKSWHHAYRRRNVAILYPYHH